MGGREHLDGLTDTIRPTCTTHWPTPSGPTSQKHARQLGGAHPRRFPEERGSNPEMSPMPSFDDLFEIEEHREALLSAPRDDVVGAVALTDLLNALADAHAVSPGTGRQVAVSEQLIQLRVGEGNPSSARSSPRSTASTRAPVWWATKRAIRSCP